MCRNYRMLRSRAIGDSSSVFVVLLSPATQTSLQGEHHEKTSATRSRNRVLFIAHERDVGRRDTYTRHRATHTDSNAGFILGDGCRRNTDWRKFQHVRSRRVGECVPYRRRLRFAPNSAVGVLDIRPALRFSVHCRNSRLRQLTRSVSPRVRNNRWERGEKNRSGGRVNLLMA